MAGDTSARERVRVPELLAPAGGMDAFLAALAAGADAVYLGLRGFNARAAAVGFSAEELARACTLAHARGVRVYVTLNVLVRDEELDAACALAGEALAAGADALIVADLGLCRVLRRALPEVELHLSTQAGVHSGSGAALAARELGVMRVTCGRELSADEIAEMAAVGRGEGCSAGGGRPMGQLRCPMGPIEKGPVSADAGRLDARGVSRPDSGRGLPRKPRPASPAVPFEVEVFCHGAICICYAGACAFSALTRGRSANRGDCTQPCRVAYDLVDERGASVVGVEGDRLLCPRDYLGIRHVAALAEAGVAALKIEGRMKNPDYVYNVVRCYRRALDAVAAGSPLDVHELDALEEQLAHSFNRGFTSAYPDGSRADGRLMSWERAINQGVRVGEVVERRHEEVVVAFSCAVGAGDTLEIRSTPGADAPADVPKRWPMVPCPADAATGERLVVRCKRKVEVGSAVHLTRDVRLVAEAASAVEALRAELPAPGDACAEGAGQAKRPGLGSERSEQEERLGSGSAQGLGIAAGPWFGAGPEPSLNSGGSDAEQELSLGLGSAQGPGIAASPLSGAESGPSLSSGRTDAEQELSLESGERAAGLNASPGPVILPEIHRPADDARVRAICRSAQAVVCRNLGQIDIAREAGVPFEVASPLAAWNRETVRFFTDLGARFVHPPEELAPGDNPQLMVMEHCVLTAEGACDGQCAVCERRREPRYLVGKDGVRCRVEVDTCGRTRLYLA